MHSPGTLHTYLIHRGLAAQADLVLGDLSIQDTSFRNDNYKLTSTAGPSYLLKHATALDKVATLRNEAAVYALLNADPAASAVAPFLPPFHSFDEADNMLVLGLLPDARTLSEHYRLTGAFPASHARAMARALAALHRLDPEPWRTLPISAQRESAPHWALGIHRPTLADLHSASFANLETMRVVQRFPEFVRLLDDLQSGWQATHPTHADVKWLNVILCAAPGSSRRTRIKLVDWELARLGDPCWDTGSVFGEYLTFWLLSIPVTGDAPPDRFLDLARYPLDRMRGAMRAFWLEYIRRMDLSAEQADEWLLRSTRYAASRLLQTAYEQGHASNRLTGNIVCLLQLAFNILQRPEQAAFSLLGIPPRGAWAVARTLR
jgi:aminoglycoside phosphotransferase (APT) family kinase protein